MKEDKTVASYVATFRTYQYHVKDFGERALVHFFKKGLASQIKDEFVHYLGSLDTLDELLNLSLQIDKRWHEHCCERNRTLTRPRIPHKRSSSFARNSSNNTSSRTTHPTIPVTLPLPQPFDPL